MTRHARVTGKDAAEADRQFLFTANRKQARQLQIVEAAEAESRSPLRAEDKIQQHVTGTECRLVHSYKDCKDCIGIHVSTAQPSIATAGSGWEGLF